MVELPFRVEMTMLTPTGEMLKRARKGRYAVGAFNIYNLEGATAVVRAARAQRSPVMLQLLPSALNIGGRPLVALCLALAEEAEVEVAVHLDHCSDHVMLRNALAYGCSSVMADGSSLGYEDNIRFTREIVAYAAGLGREVEAELGKLSGEEDGISVAAREASLTDPAQAADFAEKTGVAALAVCIGNIHGTYHSPPQLDFDRLEAIAGKVSVPLVLHGTSGLPDEMIARAIGCGVGKFNVNTEVRTAYLRELGEKFRSGVKVELVEIMQRTIDVMQSVVEEKITLFGSAGKSAPPSGCVIK